MALSGIMTTSLLSANNSMKIARVQQGAKNQMDGHAGVLDAEIKLDSARGGDVKKKQEELEETKKKASELEESTINTLSAATDDLKKAAKDDLEARRAEKERIEEIRTSASETGDTPDGVDTVSAEGTVFGSSTINVVVDSVTTSSGSTGTVGVKVDVEA